MEAQQGDSLDLDDILSLACDEFFPVDSFFDSYVGELTSRSKRQAEAQQLDGEHAVAKHIRLDPPRGAAPAGIAYQTAPEQAGGAQMHVLGLPGALQGTPTGLPAGPTSLPGMPAGYVMGGGVSTMAGVQAMQGMQPLPNMPLLPNMPPTGAGGRPPALPGLLLQGAVMPSPVAVVSGMPGAGSLAGPPPVGSALPAQQPLAAVNAPPVLLPQQPGSGASASSGSHEQEQVQPTRDQQRTGHGRHKTVKQQEANKLAQQRYRERKKQKFNELEEVVEQLRSQLSAMQATETRNSMLEAMNSELQSQLVEREREVDKLRRVLETETCSGSLGEPTAGCTLVEQDSTGLAAHSTSVGNVADPGEVVVPCSAAPPRGGAPGCAAAAAAAGAPVDFSRCFEEQIEELREFMAKHGLLQADPLSAEVPLEVVQQAAELVGRCCQTCQALLRSEGPQVLDLVAGDPTSLSEVGSTGGGGEHWRRALVAIRLTPAQQQQLLLLRSSHLEKMTAIYGERHALNLQAMSMMLSQGSSTPEGQISSIGSNGYLASAKSSAQLGACLDKIKDNLRREQRAVLDLNCCVVSRILKPLQAALYMLTMYPQHCDALALSNVLARDVPLAVGATSAQVGLATNDGTPVAA